uniref:Ataxin-7-like protein 3 n=1 Tax=Hippocampus comes TaxID=109280 RepID=A0A3Q2Y8W8_HIPCM
MKMEEVSMSGLDNGKLEGLAQDILSDLVEDACLGLCFEVHRAVKQGYFFLDDTDQESMRDFEIVDQPGLDVFGQVYNQWKNKECVCPNCSRSIAASRFAPHLEKCLGMGRNSSRIANRRIVTGNNTNNKSESDQEDNDDVNDNDWSYGAEKKAKKRKGDKVRFSFLCFSSLSFEAVPCQFNSDLAAIRFKKLSSVSLVPLHFRIQIHQEDPNPSSIRAVS